METTTLDSTEIVEVVEEKLTDEAIAMVDEDEEEEAAEEEQEGEQPEAPAEA